ncbi:MAG: hypothetical protein R2932_41000 [Caldilineaceae bacterium]
MNIAVHIPDVSALTAINNAGGVVTPIAEVRVDPIRDNLFGAAEELL